MFEYSGGYFRTLLIEEPSPSGGSTWLAIHPELPGCNAAAEKQEDALVGLEMSRDAWIKSAEKHGYSIPKPMEHPLVQVVYAANPIAYYDGEKGSGTEMSQETYSLSGNK